MISIIVPTLNSPRTLVKLLESIFAQDFPSNDYEVLIVFNRLPQKLLTPQDFPQCDKVRWLTAPEIGVNAARNTGIRAAQGDILLFIDDDILLTNLQYLKTLHRLHVTHPQQKSIGGPYLLPQQNFTASYWSWAYHTIIEDWMLSQKISSDYSRTLLGGNASYKKIVFSDGSCFTPSIRYGGSETPFNENIFTKYGPHLYSPLLVLTHQSRISFWIFIKKAYLQGRGASVLKTLRPSPPIAALQFSHKSFAHLIYNYFFMVGFRKHHFPKSTLFTALISELGSRCCRPFSKILSDIVYSRLHARRKI